MSCSRTSLVLIIHLLVIGVLILLFNLSHITSLSFLILILLFGILISLFLLVYKYFFKIKNIGFILASAHFVLIFIFSVVVYLNRNEAQFQFLWFFPEKIDFPISLLAFDRVIPIISKFLGGSYYAESIYAPFVFFVLFGSFQYYIVGKIVDLVVLQLKKKDVNNNINLCL